MKCFRILLTTVLLIGSTTWSGHSLAQRSLEASAQKAWVPFFAAFRAAVKKRDRVALKEMMARDFFYTLGHHVNDQRDSAFEDWDHQKGRGWEAFDRILARGTVPTSDRGFSNGRTEGPMRVAPPAASRRSSFRKNLINWYARVRI